MRGGAKVGRAHDGLLAIQQLPLDDLGLGEVDETVVDLAAGGNDDDVGDTLGTRGCLGSGEPGRHAGLSGLLEGHNVEVKLAMGLFDDVDGRFDLGQREGVKGVGDVGHGGG
jgi:hypothetical protein